MAIGYRSMFRTDDDLQPFDFIEQHLKRWLEEKREKSNSQIESVEWEGPGKHRLGPDVELIVVHKQVDGHAEYRLYRLLEGAFTVSFYVVSRNLRGSSSPNVVIEVDHPDDNPSVAIMNTGTPRIVGQILDSNRIYDGAARLTGSPIRITKRNSSRLVDAIADPERSVSIIAAGSMEPDLDDEWERIVEDLTRQSVGSAAIYSVDAEALAEIDEDLGPSHEIGRGRFRTYAPHVNLRDPADSLRHTWLGPATLANSLTHNRRVKSGMQYLHASSVRRRLIEREIPSSVTIAMALLKREERALLRDTLARQHIAEAEIRVAERSPFFEELEIADEREAAASPTAPVETRSAALTGSARPSSQSSGLLGRLKRLIARWLPQHDEVNVDSVSMLESFIVSLDSQLKTAQSQINELESENESLETSMREANEQLDTLELELTLQQNEAVDRERTLSELWREVSISNLQPQLSEIDDEWKPPVTMVELVLSLKDEKAKASRYVRFTGDEEGAEQIDKRYVVGRYTSQVWQYVRALYSYAERKAEKSFQGDFFMYLNSETVRGEKIPLTHYAARESESVSKRDTWRNMRVFPVPSDVDPARRKYMEAHFKPPRADTFAPRVHFYDDTSGKTGKVYIGYVGQHLENTRSASA